MDNEKPLIVLADAVKDMCARNARTRGAVAGDVYLGERFVLVALRRPVVIDGEYSDVEPDGAVVDIFDLMDDFRRAAGGNNDR